MFVFILGGKQMCAGRTSGVDKDQTCQTENSKEILPVSLQRTRPQSLGSTPIGSQPPTPRQPRVPPGALAPPVEPLQEDLRP